MGKVKAWLMDMEQDTTDILETFYYINGVDECRELFLQKHPGQVATFNKTLEGWKDFKGE